MSDWFEPPPDPPAEPPAKASAEPVPKVVAATAAAAAATIIVVAISALTNYDMPPGLEGAIATVIAFVAGYFSPRA